MELWTHVKKARQRETSVTVVLNCCKLC